MDDVEKLLNAVEVENSDGEGSVINNSSDEVDDTLIPGLEIYEGVVTEENEKIIVEWLDNQKWSEGNRRHQWYGYKRDFKNKKNIPLKDKPIINPLLHLSSWIKTSEYLGKDIEPNCVLVNEYFKDDFIGEHIDDSSFGPVIIFFSLLDGHNFLFKKKDEEKTVYVPRCSMVLLKDEARNEWTHSIPKSPTVILSDTTIMKKGDTYRRISLSYRYIK